MFMFNKIDYEKKEEVWTKIVRNSLEDWHVNLEAIVQWSPFSSEQDLLQQVTSDSKSLICMCSSLTFM